MDLLAQNAAKAQLDKKNESRRKLRQIQVREQTNEWMEVNRKKYQAEREKCVQLIMNELIEDLQKQEVKRIENIEKIYDLSAEEVGTAHRAAANLPNFNHQQNQKVQDYQRLAKTRGNQALVQEKAVALKNQELERQAKVQREKLRRDEDERLKLTAAKAAVHMSKNGLRGDKTEKDVEKRRPEFQPGLAKVLRIPGTKSPIKTDPRAKTLDVVYYDTSRPLGIMKYPQPAGLVEKIKKGKRNAFDAAQQICREQQEAELEKQVLHRKFTEVARERGDRAMKVAKLEHELQRIKNELARGGLEVDTAMNESLLGLSNSEGEVTDTALKFDGSTAARMPPSPKVVTPAISPPRAQKKGILRKTGAQSPTKTESVRRITKNVNQVKHRTFKAVTSQTVEKLTAAVDVTEQPLLNPTSHATPDQTDISKKPDTQGDLITAAAPDEPSLEAQISGSVDGKQSRIAMSTPASLNTDDVPINTVKPKLLYKKSKAVSQNRTDQPPTANASSNGGRAETPSFGTLSLSSEDSFPKTSTPAEQNQRSRDHDDGDRRSLFSKTSGVYSPRTELKRKQTLNHFIQKLLYTAPAYLNSDQSRGSGSQVEVPSSAMNSLNGSSSTSSKSDRAFDRSMSLHEAFGDISDVGQDEPSSSSNHTDLTLSFLVEEELKIEMAEDQPHGATSEPFYVAGSHAQSGSSSTTTSSGSTLAEIVVTVPVKENSER